MPALLRQSTTARVICSGLVLPPGGAAQLASMPRMSQARLERALHGIALSCLIDPERLQREATARLADMRERSGDAVIATGTSGGSAYDPADEVGIADDILTTPGLLAPVPAATMAAREQYGREPLPSPSTGGMSWPLPPPFLPAAFRVTVTHAPVFISGRYLKLARGIS